MSVMVKSKGFMARIFNTLVIWTDIKTKDFGFNFLAMEGQSEVEKIQDIHGWIDRLYIGNQLAAIYTYDDMKNDTIDRMDMKDIHESVIYGSDKKGLLEFLADLNSLRYNLFSNSGHSFVSQEDMDKLDWLIDYIKDQIVYERYCA